MKPFQNVVTCTGVVLASLMVLVLCQKAEIVNYAEHKRASDASLEKLHLEYNDQKFDQIYEAATPVLKGEVGQLEFVAGMKEVFSRFGRVIKSSDVATACFPLEVRTVRQTKYEGGDASEMIIWSIEHGQARLTSYKFAPGQPTPPTQPHRGCEGTSVVFVPSR